MSITENSLAVANAASVENVQFQADSATLARKILIIATYDPLKTLVVDEVPIQVFSPEDAGDKLGYGFMAHRLAVQTFKSSNGVPTFIVPQAEPSGAQAAGDIAFTASGVLAGTVNMYIAGLAVPFTVADADDSDAVAAKAIVAINAIKELPVTALANATPNIVDITAKTEGTFGNDISIKFNLKAGEESPTGVTTVITALTSGAGTPDISDALNGLGTGDDANEANFTDVVHGYLQDTTTLDAISAYVGAGNEKIGLYSETVARPFRVLTGDVVAGTAGLDALIALGDGRKLDRANGIKAVPGSASHPSEIAAQTIGHMARINNNVAAQSYAGIVLIDIDPGEKADRWTSEYANRDTAVKAGVSPTTINNGAVVLQNIVTFYHPDNVPVASNGYRSMRNISIIQNMLNATLLLFSKSEWLGNSIVADVSAVTNVTDRLKARDIVAVRNDLVALALSFEARAWIYNSSFTIDKLNEAGAITIRTNNDGFNSILSVIFSGEGGIMNTNIEFDTSIAVLLS